MQYSHAVARLGRGRAADFDGNLRAWAGRSPRQSGAPSAGATDNPAGFRRAVQGPHGCAEASEEVAGDAFRAAASRPSTRSARRRAPAALNSSISSIMGTAGKIVTRSCSKASCTSRGLKRRMVAKLAPLNKGTITPIP